MHDDIKWPPNLYIGAKHAYSVPVWICVCVWFCTCSTALQETLTSPPFTETFSFSVCALYPGLSLQIPGLFAETAARTMWFYSETDARRLPHIRTTPGYLRNHLQMHPQTHFQNRAHGCPSCSESKKLFCTPYQQIPVLSSPYSFPFAQIGVSVFVYEWHFNDTLTFWAWAKLRRHDAVGVFHLMCRTIEFNRSVLTYPVFTNFTYKPTMTQPRWTKLAF